MCITERLQQVANIERSLAENNDLRDENRNALEVLRDWFLEPDEDDETWWDEFNASLQQNRFTLERKPSHLPFS